MLSPAWLTLAQSQGFWAERDNFRGSGEKVSFVSLVSIVQPQDMSPDKLKIPPVFSLGPQDLKLGGKFSFSVLLCDYHLGHILPCARSNFMHNPESRP